MKFRIGFGSIIILAVGCGEVTAEPIRSTSLAITSVDIEPEASADPYACEVVRLDGSEGRPLFSFLSLGELSYGGQCQSSAPGEAQGCWYTGDIGCEQDGRECGGFTGAVDTATGEYRVSGGQHMLCPYPCTQDDQCPAGATGSARPACMHGPEFDPATEGGQCMLACDAGETCPDGFVCIQPGLSFGTSNGSLVPATAQCVQLHRLTLSGPATPP